MRKYNVAVVQMDTQDDLQANLKKMQDFIARAAENDAKLLVFPEVVNIQSKKLTALERSEALDGPTVSFLMKMAKKYNIMLCIGSILESIPNSNKVYNTCLLIGNDGKPLACYRKRHTFDITAKDGHEFRESDTVQAGEDIVLVDTELGKIGFGICYDLRFPEHFREMSRAGMEVLLLPANFTYNTGKAHWDTLIRARAIENGCYLLASDQCGQKPDYLAYGHSVIVDPYGVELAKEESEYEEALLIAEIDLDYVAEVRRQIPSTVSR